MEKKDVEALRNDYSNAGIDPDSLPEQPHVMFDRWFDQAVASGIAEPNAMVIATAGHPDATGFGLSQRTVLMKSFDENGFCFYTNYGSRKANQLDANPRISCLFPWLALHRQVAVEGRVSKASREDTERYFASRPRGSQIGAWASHQSQPLASRDEIEQRVADLEAQYKDQEIPAPPFWGGFHIVPLRFEFWQGRTSRLHDRFVFERQNSSSSHWSICQLNP